MLEAQLVREKDIQSPTGTLPIAWLEVAGRRDVAVPMARLCELLEYDRKTLYQLVQGDPVLSTYRVVVTTTRKGMPIRTALLRRPAVIGVLTKISTNRIQDPAKRERIIQFQRWAFETLDQLLFEEPRRVPAPEPQPLFPGLFRQHTKGDRTLALAMLAGEVRAPDGRLYSYQAIERLSGVPRATVARLARRHGWVRSQMNRHIVRPPQIPQQPNSELLNLLAQQVQVLQRMLKSMAR